MSLSATCWTPGALILVDRPYAAPGDLVDLVFLEFHGIVGLRLHEPGRHDEEERAHAAAGRRTWERDVDPAEDFVKRFSIFWADPSPEKMGTLLTPDVVLIQPLSAPMHGLDAAQAEFRKLFAWLPDLRATVDGWGANGDALFIDFRLHATVGGRRLEWPVVDRFVMRGDKAEKRVSYFDALPLLLAILKTPSAWASWWRSGAARPWG